MQVGRCYKTAVCQLSTALPVLVTRDLAAGMLFSVFTPALNIIMIRLTWRLLYQPASDICIL